MSVREYHIPTTPSRIDHIRFNRRLLISCPALLLASRTAQARAGWFQQTDAFTKSFKEALEAKDYQVGQLAISSVSAAAPLRRLIGYNTRLQLIETRLQSADQAWSTAINLKPTNAAAWSNRGTKRLQAGRWLL